ncbi:helix-turn-helix transcriptional regulator [Arsenophonus nasoniae]|uniref:Helix-turn-helix transcriptional regulator n=1 Tax=Arsenophonus nasoniae TaxID=638 RepID=A0AA95GVX9_9GAMM|nr:helix-turn-helix transcriptional regulator [Arsenophonus nasoniae]WGM03735.1 helix-turn-helix transcriptional regulator [Arsenophonus nasoniae]
MNSPITQFCQSLTIPCGFTNAESEVYTNAVMTDILGMTVESSQVLDVFHAHEEVVRNKRLPLSLLEYIEGELSYPVMLSQPNDMFTDREWDVLFLSLQRLSCKEIAKWLDIAVKTAEVHLSNIYNKADIHHAKQLRQFCREKRINHYIPPQLLPAGSQFISV